MIAIVAGELFTGEAEGHLDGAGTVAIRSRADPRLRCLGSFTGAGLRGSGALQCSDGSDGTFDFQRLGLRRGHGAGSSSRGSISFAYGLTAEQAAPYLVLPAGKRLGRDEKGLLLLDR